MADQSLQQKRLKSRQRAALIGLLGLLLRLKKRDLQQEAFVRGALAVLAGGYAQARAIGAGGLAPDAEDVSQGRADALAQHDYLAGMAGDVERGRYGPKPGGMGALALRARSALYVLRMTGIANAAWAEAVQADADRRVAKDAPASRERGEPSRDMDRTVLLDRGSTGGGREDSTPEVEEPVEIMARWMLGAAEHCQTCIDEAAKGWRPLLTFTRWPGDGTTECLSRCKCGVLIRDGREGFSNS